MSAELDRYDRQIRAWGFETQRKLQSAKFLFVGINLTSLECIKNLVLAGASHVACFRPVFETPDLQNLFEFIQGLNPHTKVIVVDSAPDCDFVCIVNQRQDTVTEVISTFPDKPILIMNQSEADLVYKCAYEHEIKDFESLDAVEQSLVGALLSQMVVDYLPPLTNSLHMRLNFNKDTLAASVTNQL